MDNSFSRIAIQIIIYRLVKKLWKERYAYHRIWNCFDNVTYTQRMQLKWNLKSDAMPQSNHKFKESICWSFMMNWNRQLYELNRFYSISCVYFFQMLWHMYILQMNYVLKDKDRKLRLLPKLNDFFHCKHLYRQWYSLDVLFSSWRNVRWAKDYIQWRVWLLLYWDQEKSHKLSSDPTWKTSLLSLPGGAANALCIILVFMKISEKTWCDWMNIV